MPPKTGMGMALTDAAARKVKGGERDQKLFDSGGLYLFVTRSGFKSWRFKYRFAGKEKRLTFGPYPEVGLSEARERRDMARKLIRDNIDPGIQRKKLRASAASSAERTFEKVARDWHKAQEPRWSAVHRVKTMQAFERDVFPVIGALPVRDIDGPMVLEMLRKIEARGAIDTAKRLRQHVSGVFIFAMAQGTASADPAAGVGKALLPIPRKGRQPAFTDITRARQVLRDVEASSAGPLTKLASRLLALTAVRPGIVRAARWAEFEEIGGVSIWRVPAARMKLEMELKEEEAFDHLVPLSKQAVEVLEAVRRLTGRIDLLFHSVRSTRVPMSLNTIGYAYNRCGYQGRHVPHGWRSTFSTIMNERAALAGRESDRAVIDGMLAHRPKGVSGSEMAYNRATHMSRRIEMAQEWADLLLEGMAPADRLIGDR